MASPPEKPLGWRIRAPRLVVSGVLILVTLALFSRVFTCQFISLDDPQYVTANERVQGGLTAQGAAWAFTNMEAAGWQPLTWLSLELDQSLFGLNPAGFHGVNLALHVANAVLLFLALSYMTDALAPSAAVALLFAIHPLHVESVAWVSERKDVLSTLFWMLAMLVYACYAQRPSWTRYAAVCLLFVCGLCAKPMLVTLPFVLLLLDFWPLQRTFLLAVGASPAKFPQTTIRRLILEKLPLVALSVGFSLITFAAQTRGNAVATEDMLPLRFRLMNAADAYLAYLWKAICPLDLAIIYPHPMRKQLVVVAVIGASLLCAATLLIVRRWRGQPYLAVGWFWYLGTLVPVVGLVQVGTQAIADRYTYVPLIGIFMCCAWSLQHLVRTGRLSASLTGLLCFAAFVSFGLCTWNQVGYWQDDLTLWRHSIEVTGPNWQVCRGLGNALLAQGRARDAIPYLREVVKRAAEFAPGHYSLGAALLIEGDTSAASKELQLAVELDPQDVHARQSLALLLIGEGREDDALAHLFAALQIEPCLWETHLLLSEVLKGLGKIDEADRHFRAALAINPHALHDIRPSRLMDGQDKP